MKKYFLTVVYAIDDKPETVEAILAQRPWQAVAHTDALADLEHAQADLQAATDGYDAARLEIKSLQARIQELGQMARECSDRKVVQLESALAAHVRSGKDWAMRVEALERTITTLRAQIASHDAKLTAAEKAMRELESANSIALQLDARIKELEAQLDAVGAGGVEPLVCDYCGALTPTLGTAAGCCTERCQNTSTHATSAQRVGKNKGEK